jgi:putative mycofactocin binding protein MftB
MNRDARYKLAEGVAVRPERFGGLVYRYDNRRLYFLYSDQLTQFIGGLTGEFPLAEAMEAFCQSHALPVEAGEAMLKSMAPLEKMGIVVPVAA